MHRKLRKNINEPGHAHELTFSCFRRLPLLRNDTTRIWFLEALETARLKLDFDVWAYVLMPEHVHVVVCPRLEVYDMGDIKREMKRAVGKAALGRLRKTAPNYLERLRVFRSGQPKYRFWQEGGGFDRNLYSDKAIHSSINYIQNNPVARGLVESPLDWEWSSARWYAGIRPCRFEIDPCPVLRVSFGA